MAGEELCAIDQKDAATHFCYCSGTETYLCLQHVESHEETHTPEELYVPLPISALDEHQNFGYYDRLRVRMQARRLGLDELEKNLTNIDRCIEELAQTVEEFIWKLNDFACRKVEELKAIREKLRQEIEAGRREFEKILYSDSATPVTRTAIALRHYIPESSMLTLFHFSIKKDFFPSNIDPVFTYTTRQPKESSPEDPGSTRSDRGGFTLPRIENHLLSFFDFERKVWRRPLTLKGSLTPTGYRFVLLSDNSVFLCGGRNGDTVFRSTFVVEEDGTVREREDMGVGRYAHGMTTYLKFVYVFGGQTAEQDGKRPLSYKSQ